MVVIARLHSRLVNRGAGRYGEAVDHIHDTDVQVA